MSSYAEKPKDAGKCETSVSDRYASMQVPITKDLNAEECHPIGNKAATTDSYKRFKGQGES